jgi:hypothetical protein
MSPATLGIQRCNTERILDLGKLASPYQMVLKRALGIRNQSSPVLAAYHTEEGDPFSR